MRNWRVLAAAFGLCTAACQDFGATPVPVPAEGTNPDARVTLTVEHASYSVSDTVRIRVRNEDTVPLYAWFECQGQETWADGAWAGEPLFCWCPFPGCPFLEELAGAQVRTMTWLCPRPGVYRASFVCYDVPVDGAPRTYVSKSWTVH